MAALGTYRTLANRPPNRFVRSQLPDRQITHWPRALEQDDRLHMVMDKPFIFALRNRASQPILVSGYARHAPAERSTP